MCATASADDGLMIISHSCVLSKQKGGIVFGRFCTCGSSRIITLLLLLIDTITSLSYSHIPFSLPPLSITSAIPRTQ
jgi:hypothetical protein